MMPGRKPVPQSAVIAYQRRWFRLRVLLVTSLNTQRWVLPKGHINTGLTPQESAAQEAYEEAGVEGIVASESIGAYHYLKAEHKGGGGRRVDVFPMAVSRVLSDWPEMDLRRRKWMFVADAIDAVDEAELKQLLEAFGRAMSGD
ncbi:MAG: NUDIX hydrolase [Proteobacteria bacterium]|nr:NUDIX hydrolase [Pseudomonadota bacterium]